MEEWGFPLLHDITDCLRIGDITFIKPEANNTTVEVKTKLVAQTEQDDGKVSYEYQITVVSPAEPPALPNVSAPDSDARTSPHPPRASRSERMERQLQRLHVASVAPNC